MLLALKKLQLLLKLVISRTAIPAVVYLAMTTGTDGTNPKRMIGSAISQPTGVMRFEVGLTI
jgi:hypothetical protein